MNIDTWIDVLNQVWVVVGTFAVSYFTLLHIVIKKTYPTFDYVNTQITNAKKSIASDFAKNVENQNKLEKELAELTSSFEVFKAQYDGDRKVLSLQMDNQTEKLNNILHQVNNINSLNHKAIIEMLIENKLNKT